MKRLLLVCITLIGISAQAQEKIYKMPEEGYLLFEAENLQYSELWEFHEKEEGRENVCGTGYIKYIGPVTGSGHGQEIDEEGKLQGDPKDWLVIPVEITIPGRYRINLRNHHMHKDGDNDIWVHIIDYPFPVRRVGDHAVDSYQWLTWGPEWTYFDLKKPGVYQFYIAGRSHGFGIDRIAIYNENASIEMYWRKLPAVN